MPQEVLSPAISSIPEVNKAVSEIIKDACRRVGLSIDSYLIVIREALVAVKEIKDRDGDLVDTIPDHNIRLKAAEKGLLLEGYMATSNSLPVDNSKHLHQTYVWITPNKSSTDTISTSRLPGDDTLPPSEVSGS